ncbi:Predicted metal-dependent hydrolase, TIM-barrel fold [Devosia enhydra]|uniref:Predicted metal-dependent hydrolase, TIM-barrel fold n=1 Tax=Devosia enhydra TaxID=665118 RepID=A0A1K2HTA0_9HYPH|nr:amidohydrolase [Devosia enhydra]SFZ81285.1 Predicted metal-dependent hydrolase, TIM-barrel fold [Devosia enhydra]
MRIVDTHLHLVYPDRFSYPWMRGVPEIDKPWSVEAYWAEARGLGIVSALHMEVDVAPDEMEAETAFVLGLPGIAGAIASARPESPDFPLMLERYAALGGVRGIRRLLQGEPDDLSRSPLFRENLARLPGHGMSFDICVKGHQLPVARDLVRALPQVSFILDHCGNPRVGEGEIEPWRSAIAEIAREPNLTCKISGILANTHERWTVADLRPYVEHCIESFGWNRVVWGSDHPVVCLSANLTRWVQACLEITAGESDANREALFSRNATRFYNLAPTG